MQEDQEFKTIFGHIENLRLSRKETNRAEEQGTILRAEAKHSSEISGGNCSGQGQFSKTLKGTSMPQQLSGVRITVEANKSSSLAGKIWKGFLW